MDERVELLPRSDVRAAARLLARAFAADPIIAHYLAGSRRRRLGYPAFFRTNLHEFFPLGGVYGLTGSNGLAGVAAWMPPGREPGTPDRHARLNSSIVRALYPRTGGALFEGFAGMAPLHPAEPHWYLAFVGIEPTLQGSGRGARLLAPVLERADADGVLCYLETPFPGTIAFYQRLGFQTIAETRPFAAPASVWTMIRRPVSETRS